MSWIIIAGCLVVIVPWIRWYPNPFFRDRKRRLPWHRGYDGELK